MAATVTVIDKAQVPGLNKTLYLGTILLDSSYPTGGEAIDLGGNERVDYLFTDSATVVTKWDAANQKLKAYWGNAGSASVLPEVTDTTDLSAVTVNFLAVGA